MQNNLSIQKKDLTIEQTAAFFQVGKPVIYRLIHAGDLIAYKVGKGTRIKAESVDSLRSKNLMDVGFQR